MNPPWFWESNSFSARLMRAVLSPAGGIYSFAQTARRLSVNPKSIDSPIICIGNATLGGVGKTPFALALADLLADLDIDIFFLTRGYGGALDGPLLVGPEHSSVDVGDEAQLLANTKRTVVSKNRATGAEFAEQKGARLIIMDDGFQNPTLKKDISFLLVDSVNYAAQGPIFPAGPYRETIADATQRADIIVEIRDEDTPKLTTSPLPTFNASLKPTSGLCTENPAIAFCGIGRPQKFFDMLTAKGLDLANTYAFPDHHVYSDLELDMLRTEAQKRKARLLTTEKDYVRIPENERKGIEPVPVKMHVPKKDELLSCMLQILSDSKPNWQYARNGATTDVPN